MTIALFFDSQYSGHNLLKVLAKDEKAYGRALLNILFSKDEQATGLVVATNSGRPSLDEDKVHLLLVSLQIGDIYKCALILCFCAHRMCGETS